MTDTVVIKIDHCLVKLEAVSSNPLLSAFVRAHESAVLHNYDDSDIDLVLIDSEKGFTLTWLQKDLKRNQKPLSFNIDVHKVIKQLRTFPAPKQGAFNQALGKKTRSVIDATGGWGGDALLMCMQGYSVTVVERNPIMALLLEDAMIRLSRTDWANDNPVVIPVVVNQNSVDYFNALESLDDDCVYLDPMFPPKKKKSAAVNKQMQLLQWLVGEDLDANELLQSVINAGAKRAAVKRPDYAEPLCGKPSVQFSSKLVHYDVYLNT